MRSPTETKKWGTIYLGTNKEVTMDRLDAMQAAARQEQWNQRTQNEYLDRVREKATDRAKEILGAAYTERQNILAESQEEAQRIKLESQVQYAKAEEALNQAQQIREAAEIERTEAENIRAHAQQEGFDAGLAQARDELDAFRGAMGASVAVVLQAIERQCSPLFAAWREEVTELVKVCVEKGTNWVLDNKHEDVLRALVMESVRQLDARQTVSLRVHPDDEPAVADMFAAAREVMPDVERWIVTADPSVQLGGLIAESPSSTVDNRLELRRNLVSNVLEHLTLPSGEADVLAAAAVHEIVAEQAAHIAEIAPPVPEMDMMPAHEVEHEAEQLVDMVHPDEFSSPEALGEHLLPQDMASIHPESIVPEVMTPEVMTPEVMMPEHVLPPDQSLEDHAPASFPPEEALPPMEAEAEDQAAPNALDEMAAHLRAAEANAAEFAPVLADAEASPPLSSLEELERELLPLPEEDTMPTAANSPQVDAVLASGGFLSEHDSEPDPLPDAAANTAEYGSQPA